MAAVDLLGKLLDARMPPRLGPQLVQAVVQARDLLVLRRDADHHIENTAGALVVIRHIERFADKVAGARQKHLVATLRAQRVECICGQGEATERDQIVEQRLQKIALTGGDSERVLQVDDSAIAATKFEEGVGGSGEDLGRLGAVLGMSAPLQCLRPWLQRAVRLVNRQQSVQRARAIRSQEERLAIEVERLLRPGELGSRQIAHDLERVEADRQIGKGLHTALVSLEEVLPLTCAHEPLPHLQKGGGIGGNGTGFLQRLGDFFHGGVPVIDAGDSGARWEEAT